MNATKLKFGDFELDVTGYELSRRGHPTKLERIPMELLLLLVDRRGQLVTRDEILQKLWGKEVFLDVDNSINTAISKIRVVLKDDPEDPAFIRTVPGKGYRFIAPITVLPVEKTPPRNPESRSPPEAAGSSRRSATLRQLQLWPWRTGLHWLPNCRPTGAIGGCGLPSWVYFSLLRWRHGAGAIRSGAL
jgi:DNA-binding winged helix-turn-helix (wHTH) protein